MGPKRVSVLPEACRRRVKPTCESCDDATLMVVWPQRHSPVWGLR